MVRTVISHSDIWNVMTRYLCFHLAYDFFQRNSLEFEVSLFLKIWEMAFQFRESQNIKLEQDKSHSFSRYIRDVMWNVYEIGSFSMLVFILNHSFDLFSHILYSNMYSSNILDNVSSNSIRNHSFLTFEY